MTRKYGKGAQESVKDEMHKYKRGAAKSGRAKKTVKNRKQAIAIGLSKARKKGAKVPRKSTRSTARKTTAKRSRRTTGRRKAA